MKSKKGYTQGQVARASRKLGLKGNAGEQALADKIKELYGVNDHKRATIKWFLQTKPDIPDGIIEVAKSTSRFYYQPKKVTVSSVDVRSKEFLQTYEWRKLRLQALMKHGSVCQCCGASPKTGAVMNVDHIKPRKTHPELALNLDNLQVLCHECNHGKGNWTSHDFRPDDDADLVLEALDRIKNMQ